MNHQRGRVVFGVLDGVKFFDFEEMIRDLPDT